MRQNEKNDSNRSYNLPEQILINMQVHSFGEKTVNQPWNILVKRTSSTSTIWNKKFFARTFGEQRDSAFPLRNLLELLTVNNVYRFQALKYTHLWHKNLLPNVFFCNVFHCASVLHAYNTGNTANQNLYNSRVRPNTGKQTVSCMASVLWHNIPSTVAWKTFMFISFLF